MGRKYAGGYFVQYSTHWLPALGLPVRSADGIRDFRYDLPLVPVTVMLIVGAALWLTIDPIEQLIPKAVACDGRNRIAV